MQSSRENVLSTTSRYAVNAAKYGKVFSSNDSPRASSHALMLLYSSMMATVLTSSCLYPTWRS
eukprot:7830222-Pyramimonas_sp.AAC.1